ncbi:MAG: phosphoenolpyruvate carboxykinase (ATP) [Cytophagales bacterium]|nr:MAG: phosphoenolpyruvate carboxykinase (ATP) [Cytophagales bacterium]TAF60605.1 MAG: phosphoenolpyruvate carboxykinase (ATP) [Cytophagales bacterium]
MQESGIKSDRSSLKDLGISGAEKVFWNLKPAELVEIAVRNGEGTLTDTGALMCDTGKFTGRSPKDRFVVKDSKTENTVWWGSVNIPMSTEHFDKLYQKMIDSYKGRTLYARDAYACADSRYRLNLRVVNVSAWHNLFCHHLFLRPSENEIKTHIPEFTILQNPDLIADPSTDGTRQGNFVAIDFTKKIILIGGTAYTGEMKKSIFSILNYILPQERNVLSMHCSANVGSKGDTAVFFGLSGTGKTTLSADSNRGLIGDDEHGWAEDSVFNFEGGCYAKVIDLSREKEPQIWDAVKFGTLVENTRFFEGTRTIDYKNNSVTENTRSAYPIHYIDNALEHSYGGIPQNIFFLTCDAYGILPPISKLNSSQAMYHFISGYTAKVAGTEMGVTEPQTTFSACFGQAFLPLHPTKYAKMLGEKMQKHNVNVWLVNTGWSGGAYGVGSRMKLPYTRAMITAALNGDLKNVTFEKHPIFGMMIPTACTGVPSEILNPRDTWSDKAAYDAQANDLAKAFIANFDKFADFATEDILLGAPSVLVK